MDEAFSRAFALIDQLAADTADIKSAETERTEKLDTTLRDVESVVSDLKTANARREAESRILADQVHGLRDLVPKALDGWKAAEDKKLEDLGSELRSLKLLVANRLGGGAGAGAGTQASSSLSPSSSSSTKPPITSTPPATKEKPHPTDPASSAPNPSENLPDTQVPGRYQSSSSSGNFPDTQAPESGGSTTTPKSSIPGRFQSNSSSGRPGPAIPSWQMAAASSGKSGGGGSASTSTSSSKGKGDETAAGSDTGTGA